MKTWILLAFMDGTVGRQVDVRFSSAEICDPVNAVLGVAAIPGKFN